MSQIKCDNCSHSATGYHRFRGYLVYIDNYRIVAAVEHPGAKHWTWYAKGYHAHYIVVPPVRKYVTAPSWGTPYHGGGVI